MDSIWIIVIIGIIIRVLGNSAKNKKTSQNQGRVKNPQQLEAERSSAEAERRSMRDSFAQQRKSAENKSLEQRLDSNFGESRLSKEQRIERKIQEAKAQEAAKEAAMEAKWSRGDKPYDSPPPRRQVGKKISGGILDEILSEIKDEVLKEMGIPGDTQKRGSSSRVESFEERETLTEGMSFSSEGRAEPCSAGKVLAEGECYDPFHQHKPLEEKTAPATNPLSLIEEEMSMGIFEGESLSKKDILNGIVMFEVLGPPKALRNVK